MNKSLLLILGSLIFNCAYSLDHSGGVGNGGDAIICPDSTRLLDMYEAQKILTLDIGNDTSSYESIVDKVTNKLIVKDESLALKIKDYAYEIITDLNTLRLNPGASTKFVYLGYDVIGEIQDSAHRSIPRGCVIKQLVSQIQPKYSFQKRYEIDQTIWEQMDKVQQSMTILHEAIYRVLIENGAIDSTAARYLNGLFSSKEFDEMGFVEYIENIRETELKNYTVINKSSLVYPSKIHINLKTAKLDDEKMCISGTKIKSNIKKVGVAGRNAGLANIKYKKACFKNSRIKFLELDQKYAKKRMNFVMRNYLVRTTNHTQYRSIIHFHDNGAVKNFTGLKYEALYKMYYICNGDKTFTKESNTCSGPYLHKDSKVSKPTKIRFDRNEVPTEYNFPQQV